MNILWVGHHVPYPPKMGALIRSYNLIAQICREHRVSLLAFNQKALIPDEARLSEAKIELERFAEVLRFIPYDSQLHKLGRSRLLASNFFSTFPYDVNWMRSEEMVKEIEKAIRTLKIDLVHFDTIGLAQYRSHIGEIPSVLNHHNIESHMMLRRGRSESNILKKTYFLLEAIKLRKYERRVCREFSANLAVSDLDSERLKRICPEAVIMVVPNGVDTDYFCPSEKDNDTEQSLLFVGGAWYTNLDAMRYFFREMWPSLSKEFPRLKFWLVGRDWETFGDTITVNRDKVIMPGVVKDIREYFHGATIFLCPMRTGGGTRLKILDALACGKPIVATSMGCEGIDVTHGKNVLIADTAYEFCSATRRLLLDSGLRKALGREARRLAEEKYGWGMIGRRMSGFYRALTPEKNPGNSRPGSTPS
jgi:glycosyltransferase involved in cell wall biosynthesis